MTDKIFDFIVNSIRADERRRWEGESRKLPYTVNDFSVDRKAGELVEPAKKCGVHHREREKHYTTKLEEAEKELREKGISIEVYDQNTQTYMNPMNSMCSGAITGGVSQQFQPRIDQKLLDNVKNAKNKMLEHREKAEKFERLARAFALAPEQVLRLSVGEIDMFKLEADSFGRPANKNFSQEKML